MFPSYRNQPVDLESKSTDWFLFDRNIGHYSIYKFDETKNSKQNNSDDDSTLTNFSTNKDTVLNQTAYAEL